MQYAVKPLVLAIPERFQNHMLEHPCAVIDFCMNPSPTSSTACDQATVTFPKV
jgi:hypothetical protein